MSIKDIITVPNEILKKISEPIEKIGTNEKKLIKDLFDTMYASNGIGLAAVQIGVLKRILVIDVSAKDEPKKPLYIVNPKIIWKSEEVITREEGCLSIPGYFAEITRPSKCKIQYLDYNGNEKEDEVDNLLSTCIQHEVDHLNGVLFIDYLSKLKKDMIIKKLIKHKKDIERVIV